MKSIYKKYRLTAAAELLIKTVLILCIAEGCAVAAYIMQAEDFGVILARRVGMMVEYIFAALMVGIGGSLLIDLCIRRRGNKR